MTYVLVKTKYGFAKQKLALTECITLRWNKISSFVHSLFDRPEIKNAQNWNKLYVFSPSAQTNLK